MKNSPKISNGVKIPESKNLRYTKTPFDYFEPREKVEPAKCVLESFHSQDDRLELHFKNGTHAFIEARNFQGGIEVDQIEKRLKDFISRSYEDILEANF